MTRKLFAGALVAMLGIVYAPEAHEKPTRVYVMQPQVAAWYMKAARWRPDFDQRVAPADFNPALYLSNEANYLDLVALPGTNVALCDADIEAMEALSRYAARWTRAMPVMAKE